MSLAERRIDHAAGFGKVAVLYGGRSAERDISLQSGQAVLVALQAGGVDAHGLDVDENVIMTLLQGRYDRAFIVLHGRGGEDGTMQGVLETMGMPYTGSGVLGSALAMDKLMTKQVWRGLGLPTPRHIVLTENNAGAQVAAELGLPLAVKPASEGSSLGMTKVTDAEQIPAAFTKAVALEATVLAERWITGREITAAILDDVVLPLIHVETPREFYDYEAKYQADSTHYHCPCNLTDEQEEQLKQLALRAFTALECRGWGRVDMMLDEQDLPWLIEANTVPGMTDHSLVPMAARAAGIEFEELVWRILETSLDGVEQ